MPFSRLCTGYVCSRRATVQGLLGAVEGLLDGLTERGGELTLGHTDHGVWKTPTSSMQKRNHDGK